MSARVAAALLALLAAAAEARPDLRLAVATTVENSGLLEVLLGAYRLRCECEVHAVPVGTAQALAVTGRGDADAAITHSEQDELAFLASGRGRSRVEFMRNEFLIAGPPDDPARISGKNLADALAAIAAERAKFVSRGDESGTHRAEQLLWKRLGTSAPAAAGWYLSSGTGMGRALLVADQLGAYVLTDSATLARFANERSLKLVRLAADDPPMANVYSIMVASGGSAEADLFAVWLRGTESANLLASLTSGGRQLFRPVP